MAEIILTRGLPGSGKSTFAREWVDADPTNRVRVNRDDIRFMLYGKYRGVDEQTVTRVEEAAVRDALATGRDVVVDAMHLAARYVKKWWRFGEVRTIDFPIPVAECIARDAERERNLGPDVIRGIARRYGIKDDGTLPTAPEQTFGRVFRPAPERDPYLNDAYLFDIDGTLAAIDHRSPYAKDADEYAKDGVHEDVANLARALSEGHVIICLSGREDRFREVTERWLLTRCFLKPDELHMRATDDKRSDDVVKAEIFDREIAGRVNVIGVIDDRPRVLRMWRQKGLTTYRVGDIDTEF